MAKVEVIKSKNAGTPNYIWIGIVIIAIVSGVGIGIFNNMESFNTNTNTDNDNSATKTKETLYKISVDNFDYFKNDLISFSEKYTAKLDGESLSASVYLRLHNNDREKDQCYYSSQAKFNNGSSTTIQGQCTYNVSNNILTVNGTFNKLEIPSSYEQNMGVPSTNSKEDAHIECQINGNGESITCGKITYYNFAYSESIKRNSDYFLIDKKHYIYDEYGVGISNSEYTVNLEDYEIKEVTSMPY